MKLSTIDKIRLSEQLAATFVGTLDYLVNEIVRSAVLEEREACAQLVEDGYVGNRVETDCGDEIRKKAAAIRVRTTPRI